MKLSFVNRLNVLGKISSQFDDQSNLQKLQCLKQLSGMNLPGNKLLLSYYDALLFNCAYPSDEKQLRITERELLRISGYLKRKNKGLNKIFENTGLPYTKGISTFSYDCLRWLLTHPNCKTEINSYEDATFALNEVLKLTLPSIERSETTAGLNNTELLARLKVKPRNQLSFLITELSKLDDMPYIKDHLFEELGLYVDIFPKDKFFSRSFNRISISKKYFHQNLIKLFDHEGLLKQKLPAPVCMTNVQRKECILIIKNSMALMDRETDPTTFIQEHSIRLYELERGISIAVYGMIPSRQLPLDSYVGYTLFKNGFPAAYGGGWVFGECAFFGINIFETFRGGESGYMMCQLLRVYRQVFNVDYFEVEPYQFGLDNPEGIASGAFWFYYRYGFRPLDKKLLKISNEEYKKIRNTKTYRTSKKVLVQFTESNIALKLGKGVPVKSPDIATKVSQMISSKYNGNRLIAEQDCVLKFKNKTGFKTPFNKDEKQVLLEVALWCEAFEISEKNKLDIMMQMIKTKPVDLYKYQKLLLKFFC